MIEILDEKCDSLMKGSWGMWILLVKPCFYVSFIHVMNIGEVEHMPGTGDTTWTKQEMFLLLGQTLSCSSIQVLI
jgi:hypothetical protein